MQKGTTIVFNLGRATRDPAIFVNPETFDPDRYLTKVVDEESGGTDRVPSFSFGTGPHACVGRFLALLEGRMLAADFIRTFDFEFPPGYTFGLSREPECLLAYPQSRLPLVLRKK